MRAKDLAACFEAAFARRGLRALSVDVESAPEGGTLVCVRYLGPKGDTLLVERLVGESTDLELLADELADEA